MNQTNNVRNILLRALFEPDFHNALISNPEKAIRGYDLSDEEKQLLINPTAELYRYVSPVADMATSKFFGDTPPTTTTTTTVAVIVVVAITVFVTAVATSKSPESLELEKYHPLINAIKSSSGSARFDLVRALINELTREH